MNTNKKKTKKQFLPIVKFIFLAIKICVFFCSLTIIIKTIQVSDITTNISRIGYLYCEIVGMISCIVLLFGVYHIIHKCAIEEGAYK